MPIAAVIAGCTFDPPTFTGSIDATAPGADASVPDARVELDAAPEDLGPTDASTIARDAEPLDLGADDAGFADVDPIDLGFGDAADAGFEDAGFDADVGFEDAADAGFGADAGDAGPPPFTYRPTNFDPSNVTDWSGSISVGAGERCALQTNGAPNLRGACGPNAPVPTLEAQDSGRPVVVVAMSSLDVATTGTIELTGSRAVIFLVRGGANISGSITANAAGIAAAAGSADDPTCGSPQNITGQSGGSSGGGGGGGGGYGFAGADGGDSAGNANNGNGGASNGSDPIDPLRGGCSGGAGGSSNAAAGGAGGAGGGAIQISSSVAINAGGAISASGGGGAGAGRRAGGGGGGSGGAILLEAPAIFLPAGARILTNGGGGGEGGAEDSGDADGEPGDDGATRTGNVSGGSMGNFGGGNGGEGGSPVAGAGLGSPGNNGAAGGGGGGGGAGRIRLRGVRICDVSAQAIFSGAQRRDCP